MTEKCDAVLNRMRMIGDYMLTLANDVPGLAALEKKSRKAR